MHATVLLCLSVPPAPAPAAAAAAAADAAASDEETPRPSSCGFCIADKLVLAAALSIDALLLQQQHALSLLLQMQLYQPLEEIVITWSLLAVVVSIEEVSKQKEIIIYYFSSLYNTVAAATKH